MTPIAQALPKKSGFVYLLCAEGGYYKIGKSKSPQSRVKAFRSLPFKVRLVHQIKSANAPWLERFLHERFADCCIIGEWFRLSDADVAAIASVATYDGPILSLRVLGLASMHQKPIAARACLYARIPTELWERLQAKAKENQRSVTKEVVWMLMQHLKDSSAKQPGKSERKQK
jgi:hypothetical protein